ncbi:MAG: serine hydrolase domain-containing protein, partial [Gemmatimonadales bacterium]
MFLGVTQGSAIAQGSGLSRSQIARIDSIFAPYDAADVPGCALALSRHETVVFERAWGIADLEHSVPITPETIFEAGSVSKQFTAAAILRLVQQGKLSLDDDVRKYVPEVPAYEAPITIRDLIHHTSGLRDWSALVAIGGSPRGTRVYTHAYVLDLIRRQRGLNYPVGTQYLYSNSNYNLLAIIAERVSGKTLPEYTKAELFDPLGMTHT